MESIFRKIGLDNIKDDVTISFTNFGELHWVKLSFSDDLDIIVDHSLSLSFVLKDFDCRLYG